MEEKRITKWDMAIINNIKTLSELIEKADKLVIFDEFGVANNPKNDRCLNIARDLSSGSYEDIYYRFEILVDLIKKII